MFTDTPGLAFSNLNLFRMATRIAVFPGTFDPVTRGHEAIIRRALPLFDKIIVAIGVNSSKSTLFTLAQREDWLKKIFENEPKVEISTYEGLTVTFCREKQASFILRGLRNTVDFEYEKTIGQMNLALENGIETVFLMTDAEFASVQSTLVRDIFRHGGDVSRFVPSSIQIR